MRKSKNLRDRQRLCHAAALHIMILLLLLMCAASVFAEEEVAFDGTLRIENGTLLPMCTYSDPRDPAYSNEDSDILRFCVYVETDHDTDGDGLADLVKAMVQVPRGAVEGKYKAATIYDPTPYGAGNEEKEPPTALQFSDRMRAHTELSTSSQQLPSRLLYDPCSMVSKEEQKITGS